MTRFSTRHLQPSSATVTGSAAVPLDPARPVSTESTLAGYSGVLWCCLGLPELAALWVRDANGPLPCSRAVLRLRALLQPRALALASHCALSFCGNLAACSTLR
eukprot:Amastigsp_a683407_20.p1 type:complete len:104 gc:universal Amastigsp_a683407_20:187-498(+)